MLGNRILHLLKGVQTTYLQANRFVKGSNEPHFGRAQFHG